VNEYPIVKMRHGKLKQGNRIWKKKEAVSTLSELSKRHGCVYVLDVDGYKRNSPNLDIYKKTKSTIWVDAYPRYAEDVMDILISGSEKVTIWNLNDNELKQVKDMCEGDIFIGNTDVKVAEQKISKFGFNGLILTEDQRSAMDVQTWKTYQNEEIIKQVK
jgi:hypothetical protein